jgi:hypothetical protein
MALFLKAINGQTYTVSAVRLIPAIGQYDAGT